MHTASDLALGKGITIQTHGYDKYERTIGNVINPPIIGAPIYPPADIELNINF